MRPLIVRYSNLANPDGSALLCQGNTVVQACVFGPTEVTGNREKIDRAALFVIFKPKNSCNKTPSKQEFYESFLLKALESVICLDMHPRTSITVVIQEIQDDGSILSTALNASCAALLDAGIPMRSLITGIIFEINEEGNIFLDPNSETSSECQSKLIMVLEGVNHNTVSLINEGNLTVDQIKKCLKMGRIASREILSFYEESMKKRFLSS